MFKREICLQISFLVVSLSGFGIRAMLASENVRKCSVLLNFLKEFEKDWHELFKCLVKLTSEAICSGIFFPGKFSIIDLISLLVMGHWVITEPMGQELQGPHREVYSCKKSLEKSHTDGRSCSKQKSAAPDDGKVRSQELTQYNTQNVQLSTKIS